MGRPVLGRLGPFTGGMSNAFGDVSALADNELVTCDNFDLDIDGSLQFRMPVGEKTTGIAAQDGNVSFIGSYSTPGTPYLIAQVHRSSSTTYDIYALRLDTFAWTLIRADLPSSIAVQYADLVFIIPSVSGKTGGYWNGTTFTADANMPAGTAAVAYKQRLWVAPGAASGLTSSAYHALRFTEPINPVAPTPLTWTATNSISVNPGDGQVLMDIQVYNDNLMCFKTKSTYVYGYDVLPSDGAIRLVNGTIGAVGPKCVAEYENVSYVMNADSVYEIVNYNFNKINNKVKFKDNSAVFTSFNYKNISIVFDKLVVRFKGNTYCFNLKTRTWSTWSFAGGTQAWAGPFIPDVKIYGDPAPTIYYAGAVESTKFNYYLISDGITESPYTAESITATLQTKNYDYGQPSTFKRITWWGADVLSTGQTKATIAPVVEGAPVPWSGAAAYTWAQLGTWGAAYPLDLSITETSTDPTGLGRKFLKFIKAIRFRQVNFKLVMGPVSLDTSSIRPRVYSLSAAVAAKELVTKKVN